MLLLTIVPVPRGAPFVLLLATVPVALVPIVLLKTTVSVHLVPPILLLTTTVTIPLGAYYKQTNCFWLCSLFFKTRWIMWLSQMDIFVYIYDPDISMSIKSR